MCSTIIHYFHRATALTRPETFQIQIHLSINSPALWSLFFPSRIARYYIKIHSLNTFIVRRWQSHSSEQMQNKNPLPFFPRLVNGRDKEQHALRHRRDEWILASSSLLLLVFTFILFMLYDYVYDDHKKKCWIHKRMAGLGSYHKEYDLTILLDVFFFCFSVWRLWYDIRVDIWGQTRTSSSTGGRVTKRRRQRVYLFCKAYANEIQRTI